MKRVAAGGLSMSALALIAWVAFEGWSGVATAPIPGDVPTHGFGTTTHEDGSPVKLGERITPPQAVRRVVQDSGVFQTALRKCFGDAELFQHEFDAYMLLGKNVGPGAVCRSTIPGKLKAKQYAEACKTILDFGGITRTDPATGKRVRLSCKDRANGCYGVWRAREAEYKLCSDGEYPK